MGAAPAYTFFSLCRGLFAYVLSLGFTLVYGYWAAKDRVAERVLVPLLDVLQSIPVLGFMPGLVLALVGVFPNSNVGLEMAAVLMIFTGQAWNMTFSFYHSLRGVPREQIEVATLYRFGWWRRLRRVELPFATTGLVWNSMMSMAGGWFFLMINEAFQLGDRDFRLPGLGSYMSVAAANHDRKAQAAAIFAMIVMIVVLDQLLWRPLVVWAQKFRIEEGGQQEAMSSWFYDFLRRSRVLPLLGGLVRRMRTPARSAPPPAPVARAAAAPGGTLASRALFVALILVLGLGGYKLVLLIREVPPRAWLDLTRVGLYTLGRVVAATVVGTLWALPAGIAVGLSPRLSRLVQPVAQVAASFPAPMLFPAVIGVLDAAHVSLDWGSVVLMLLGTQWYIFFNVIAGSVAIPADLREAATSYHWNLRQRFSGLYLPAVFPYLVTGWVTATGGAWNASIVSEYYVVSGGEPLSTEGLGSAISIAAAKGNFPVLAAAVAVMSALVVVFNRTVWHRCYRLAERRFSLDK